MFPAFRALQKETNMDSTMRLSRTQAEKIQKQGAEFRLKQSRSFDEMEESSAKAFEKHQTYTNLSSVWEGILKMLTTNLEETKGEDERWTCYFRKITENDQLECPNVFLNKDLSKQDAIIHISVHISAFRKTANKAFKEHSNAHKRKTNRENAAKKREEKLKRKAETALGDQAEVEAKISTEKPLDHPRSMLALYKMM